jgi:C1A family cysteine protease
MVAAMHSEAALSNPGLKSDLVTPLEQIEDLDHSSVEALRAISVTSVEELLGLIAADADALVEFLPNLDLPQIQADADSVVEAPVLAEFESFEEPSFAMGALVPEEVESEKRASPAYVKAWLPEGVVDVGPAKADAPQTTIVDCFGPIRDQGNRGTCVAHATCAVLECQEARRTGEKSDLSEQFIFWNAKEADGSPGEDGTWLRVAMPGTEHDGACLESVWTYNPEKVPGNVGQGPPPAAAPADASGHPLRNPTQLDRRDPDALRRALDQRMPAAISVPVYKNWYANPATKRYGLIPMPLGNSVRVGGHAMCVAGYGWDPQFAGGGYFIVRNSWGVEWASESPVAPGYGAIPFLYVEKYGWEIWAADSGV